MSYLKPLCNRCLKQIDGEMLFEDLMPVHKACYGKQPTFELPDPKLPYVDGETYEFRVWLAMTVIAALAFFLLP